MGKKPPDPPDDDLEEKDTQKPIVNLGGVDEDQSEHNLSLATHIAHLKWKSVPETIRGIELSAYSHGYNDSSDTAFHHAQAEEEHQRQHQPQKLWFVDSVEESEEDDDAPLQP